MLSPEITLIHRLQRGDAASFEQLLRAEGPLWFASCYLFAGGDNQKGSEVFESFVREARRLSRRLRADVPLPVQWASLLGRVLQMVSRKGGTPGAGVEMPPGFFPAASADERARMGLLVQAFLRLSPENRFTILLRDLWEFGFSEMSRVLGISEDKVRHELGRARLEFRQALAEILSDKRGPR